jgi:hypothetical protein
MSSGAACNFVELLPVDHVKGTSNLERQGFAMRWASFLALPAISAGAIAVGLTLAPTASAVCQNVNGSIQCGNAVSPVEGGVVATPATPATPATGGQYPCIEQWDVMYACNSYEFGTGSMHYLP